MWGLNSSVKEIRKALKYNHPHSSLLRLTEALHYHALPEPYLKATKADTARIDLDGNISDKILASDEQYAIKKLEKGFAWQCNVKKML